MIKHHSYKIQNVIQKELFAAKHSIKICVAWFTNDLLFQPLLLKLDAGVEVTIITNKDEINFADTNDVDFDEFIQRGGCIYWNERGDKSRLLHHKFCIIDDSVVISGSYNWTNGAEYNDEDITVYSEEPETTKHYSDIFDKLAAQLPKSKGEVNRTTYQEEQTVDLTQQLQARYCEIGEYIDGLAKVCRTIGNSRLWGFVNEQGEEVVPCKYNNINYPRGGFAIVKLGEYEGIIDKFGTTILPCCYNRVTYMILNTQHSEKYFLVDRNGKCGIFTSNQTWIIETEFDSIYQYSYFNHKFGVWIVKQNNKWGIRKHNGKLILECIYNKITPSHKRVSAQIIEQRKNHPLIKCRGINKWDYIPNDSILTLTMEDGFAAIDLAVGYNIFEDGISPTFDSLEELDRFCEERNNKYLKHILDEIKVEPWLKFWYK
uniref:phospholipase D-like domain-containing protein n=1 Tax=Alistipes sp. TaxID=1872444 RepID=UPI0040576079